MIRVWCADARLRFEIEMALMPYVEYECISDWVCFEPRIAEARCSVVVLSKPVPERVIDTLRQLSRRNGDRGIGPTSPLVIVDAGMALANVTTDGVIAQRTISASAIAGELLDTIAQEVARSALANCADVVRGSSRIHGALRSFIRLHLAGQHSARTIEELAEHAGVRSATLRRYWRQDLSTSLRLQDFFDLVSIMRVRAQKTSKLTWNEVAAKRGLSARVLRRTSHRVIGKWPHGGADWIAQVSVFRETVASIFPSEG